MHRNFKLLSFIVSIRKPDEVNSQNYDYHKIKLWSYSLVFRICQIWAEENNESRKLMVPAIACWKLNLGKQVKPRALRA